LGRKLWTFFKKKGGDIRGELGTSPSPKEPPIGVLKLN